MTALKSWAALLNREYLEHRMAFVYFPIGILVLIGLAAASALTFNRTHIVLDITTPATLKVFEIGYLALAVLWLAYLFVALFFYFGDAFAADRRNNAMFFWKSMPVTDLKMLVSKFLAGVLLFPAILFLVTMVSGLMHFAFINLAVFVLPNLIIPPPVVALTSYANVSVFVIVYTVLALLWFAPFFAWVGGLSAVFGRWSLVLAFLIPGVLAVVENVALFGYGPRGGYVWAYLSRRLDFGFDEHDFEPLILSTGSFSAADYTGRLLGHIDWVNMGIGLAFTALALWAASEYRRRRLV
jgi:ABC-2 type transport system permease protein